MSPSVAKTPKKYKQVRNYCEIKEEKPNRHQSETKNNNNKQMRKRKLKLLSFRWQTTQIDNRVKILLSSNEISENTFQTTTRCLVCAKEEHKVRAKIVINLNFRETQIYYRTQLTK